jgi:hypothetical protein
MCLGWGATGQGSRYLQEHELYWIGKRMELNPFFSSMNELGPVKFVARSQSWSGCYWSWLGLSFHYIHCWNYII